MSEPTREERVNEVIARYLRAAEAGERPDRDALVRDHAELAGELRSFLADQDAVLGTVRYFGDYELLGEIARGGMGVVFKARQVSLNRIVALKMILAGQLASEPDVQRFRREAEAAANLDHPNIVPIYEVGEHEGQHYFSMKLVEGQTLADVLADPATRHDLRRLVALLSAVARAVDHAHRRGVLHRDLKPANILIDRDGTPLVTDFGLARRVCEPGQTPTGAIVGTPAYMSPEQARGEKGVSTAADVYALGALMYEALTGQPPFRAESPIDTILQVLEREPAWPDGLDRDLATVCRKSLEKLPADRYESARDLADELQRWLDGEPVAARPDGLFRSRIGLLRRQPWRVNFLLFTTAWPVLFVVWLVSDGRLSLPEAAGCLSFYLCFVLTPVLNPRWFLQRKSKPPLAPPTEGVRVLPAEVETPPPGLREVLGAAAQGAVEGLVLSVGVFVCLAMMGDYTGFRCPWDSLTIPLALLALSGLAFGLTRGVSRLFSPLPSWRHSAHMAIYGLLICLMGSADLSAGGPWQRFFAWLVFSLFVLISLAMVTLLVVWGWLAWRRGGPEGAKVAGHEHPGFPFLSLCHFWLPGVACAAARWWFVPGHEDMGFYLLWQAALLGYAASVLLIAVTGYTLLVERFWTAINAVTREMGG